LGRGDELGGGVSGEKFGTVEGGVNTDGVGECKGYGRDVGHGNDGIRDITEGGKVPVVPLCWGAGEIREEVGWAMEAEDTRMAFRWGANLKISLGDGAIPGNTGQ
jgi:hypothetical protein